MMAMAVAVMSFAALLLAVNTLLFDRDDKLFGNSVELSDFLVAQATKNILGSLLVRRDALLGNRRFTTVPVYGSVYSENVL